MLFEARLWRRKGKVKGQGEQRGLSLNIYGRLFTIITVVMKFDNGLYYYFTWDTRVK